MSVTWKFDKENRDAIIEMVKNGHSRTGAGLKCGITPATICAWMKKGKAAKSGAHFNFYNDIKKAEGEAVAIVENIIFSEAKDKTAKSHITAAIFWLKCRLAREWSERLVHQMQGEATVTHEHVLKDYSKLTEVELRAKANELQGQFNSILKTGKIPENISVH